MGVLRADVSADKDAEQRERPLTAERQARGAAGQDQGLPGASTLPQEVDELKIQFLSSVSHALRGPLSSIVSCTELIAEEKDRLSPAVAGFLDVVERSAGQLTGLVGDLLLLSRIDAGVMALELAPAGVDEVVADAVRGALPAAQRCGVALGSSVGEGPPVAADRALLGQVIGKLISNAVAFTSPGDTVRVAATCTGGEWRIAVTDSGMGIPEAERDHVFERFFRASNGRRAGRPGSGLGLAVARALTELHGGRVELTSALDTGSTFVVVLTADSSRARAHGDR